MSNNQNELNLEGKWWVPNKERELRVGKLTLNQQQKHGELTLYGSFSPKEDNNNNDLKGGE